jgi:hypothetical protein
LVNTYFICMCVYGKKKELFIEVREKELLYKPKQISI